MGMGRGGLVAYVEAEIERKIALGQLHPSGEFASEAELARRYRVCRGTMREALRRLAARGLVVQRPGRRTRAVALDESLTLENLGLALHDACSPDARWLLEGYFSLRRQVLVELLTDCCTRASERDLNQLGQLCFQLWDAARWAPGERCAQVEFELLRLAARVAERPGHVLLVQSLQRAFLGGATRLLPLLGGEGLRQWATCATQALNERDAQALQHELPAMVRAYDERLLNAFAPTSSEPAAPLPQEERLGSLATAPKQEGAPEECPRVEGRVLGSPASAIDAAEMTGSDSSAHVNPLAVEPGDTPLMTSATLGPISGDTGAECASGDGMGDPLGNLSDERTRCDSTFPTGRPKPEPRRIGACGQPIRMEEAHDARSHPRPCERGFHASSIHRILVNCLDTLRIQPARFIRARRLLQPLSRALRLR
ncbi:FadR/GntR family transcriptional regulator [Corallococcus sp. RDP092CA]|uniref:FadR/GntR family transcriptional regulator n=1 Tax=Corallococcus sp. RDP092CA TaxID=3109369 RepID=UPI0035B09757